MDLAGVGKLFQQIDSAVGRGIIDDNDLDIRVLLFQDGFEAALDKSAAVVSYQRDGD
jgi:hypothetical protein